MAVVYISLTKNTNNIGEQQEAIKTNIDCDINHEQYYIYPRKVIYIFAEIIKI